MGGWDQLNGVARAFDAFSECVGHCGGGED
jgi:hypothetical protein